MDCHKVFNLLINFDKDALTSLSDEQIKQALDAACSCLDKSVLDQVELDQKTITKLKYPGWDYLHLILYAIKTLCDTELNDEDFLLTVNQFQIVQRAIEVAAVLGILPQLRIRVAKVYPKVLDTKQNNDDIFEKHKILIYTVDILLGCFDKIILRPAVITQLDCLLAALLQLSHAPLKKPMVQNTVCISDSPSKSETISNSEFQMTTELYTKLIQEQATYYKKLHELIINCPQSLLIKEFMILMGLKNNPKWLQAKIKSYLIDQIMLSNGVTALTLALCNDVTDLGKCWDKLEIAAQIVAKSHGQNIGKYYDSVCPQIIEMMSLKNNRQGILVANCYIKALYDYKPEICINKIIHVIMEPILLKYNNEQNSSKIIKTENEITQCIENLNNIFVTKDADFKCMPSDLLIPVALPLFYLYIKSYKSVFLHCNKVQRLLLQIFSNKSKTEMIFSVFLNYRILKNDELGKKLNFQFGDNGEFEITSQPISIQQEELADRLFDLVVKDEFLSFNLFIYLLKILPELSNLSQEIQKGTLLETTDDTILRIEKQLSAVKLLTLLSSSSQVQKKLIKNPEPLLDFIKFSFSKLINAYNSDDELTYEHDVGILYSSLMLIKIILTDGNFTPNWKIFQDFITYIRQKFDLKIIPTHIVSIVEEIEIIVKKKETRSFSRSYADLSIDDKNISEFDKALNDLRDPLLPVQAHGIMSLTKLIERRHPEVSAKKDILFCIFKENLNHDDSFLYLAAINGICAMTSLFPEDVIIILVKEFIGITEQTNNRDIPPETRAKLGEILVKTARALGEMTPKYKNLLINGFLTGTRDPDALVRASSLSCLGEVCKMLGFKLGNIIIEVLYCISCIIKTDKDDGCRRAAVLVTTLLLQGLGKDTLTQLGENLVTLYRNLKHLRDTDKDSVLRLHAQLALEEFDDIVQQFLFTKPKLEKSIFILQNQL